MTTIPDTSRERALALDQADALASLRELFDIPEDTIYLDGNSLGALPKSTARHVGKAITEQWGSGLIRSWNDAGWVDLPSRVGAQIGQLIGAADDEIVACDSTSVNLFKVLAAALSIQAQTRPERTLIVSERENFPTDLYIAQGLANLLNGDSGSGYKLVLIDHPADLNQVLRRSPAVVLLTHVNYRTGAMHDMPEITRKVHSHGALVIWDLAHSAGAVPVDLRASQADFAIGCGYKYLNGGPGAPAFVWVAKRHQNSAWQPLTGWFGHHRPFDFDANYEPACGILRYLCGTPSVLGLSALECGVRSVLAAQPYGGMAALREKSIALCEYFVELVDGFAEGFGLRLASPRESAKRGSQISYHASADLDSGFALMAALIANKVIGDFRAPDVLRFGFTPLYTRFVDVWDAARVLREILESRAWDQPRFHIKSNVT